MKNKVTLFDSEFEFLKRMIKKDKTYLRSLGEDIKVIELLDVEDKHIGFASFREEKAKDSIEILYLAIQKKYQKQKLGTLLVRCCENIAKNKGFSGLYLTSEENAKGFYRKCGMTSRNHSDRMAKYVSKEPQDIAPPAKRRKVVSIPHYTPIETMGVSPYLDVEVRKVRPIPSLLPDLS